LLRGGSQGYPRSARLTRPGEYRRVFEDATRSSDQALTLLARSNDAGRPRLGLAISKKCAPRAVQRHRIKRLVRESFRSHQQELPAVDIVVMCRRRATEMTNRELFGALHRHWRRLSRNLSSPQVDAGQSVRR